MKSPVDKHYLVAEPGASQSPRSQGWEAPPPCLFSHLCWSATQGSRLPLLVEAALCSTLSYRVQGRTAPLPPGGFEEDQHTRVYHPQPMRGGAGKRTPWGVSFFFFKMARMSDSIYASISDAWRNGSPLVTMRGGS